MSNIVTISSKAEHACAIKINKKLTCWGKDYNGETNIPSIFK